MSSTECRSCGAPIRWVRTAKTATLIPLDANPNADGNVELDGDGHAVVLAPGVQTIVPADRWMPHFATCPHADRWSK